jgi:hypothetical protein
MLQDKDIYFSMGPDKIKGVAVAFVIDNLVVEAIPTTQYFARQILLQNPIITSEIIDGKEVIIFNVNGNIEKLLTTERFTAVLLSNPEIIEITPEKGKCDVGWGYRDGLFIKPAGVKLRSDHEAESIRLNAKVKDDI